MYDDLDAAPLMVPAIVEAVAPDAAQDIPVPDDDDIDNALVAVPAVVDAVAPDAVQDIPNPDDYDVDNALLAVSAAVDAVGPGPAHHIPSPDHDDIDDTLRRVPVVGQCAARPETELDTGGSNPENLRIWFNANLTLRHGFAVPRDAVLEARPGRAQRSRWIHAEQWQVEGALREAFKFRGPGGMCARKKKNPDSSLAAIVGSRALGPNKNYSVLNAKALVNFAYLDLQADAVKRKLAWLRSESDEGLRRWLCVHRGFDEATHELTWGKMLTDKLRTWMRARLCARAGRSGISQEALVEEFEKVDLRGSGPSFVFGQRAFARWGVSGEDGSAIIAPAVLIESNTAACLRRALDDSLPYMSLGVLARLAPSMRAIALSLTRDGLPANNLMIQNIALELQSVPNLLLWASAPGGAAGICSVHILWLVQKYLFTMHAFLNPLYCVNQLLHLRECHTQLVHGTVDLITRELDYLEVGGAVVDADAAFRQVVLEITVLREPDLTRARQDIDAAERERRATFLRTWGCKLVRKANGNWMKPRVQHRCSGHGCCRGRWDCVLQLVTIIVNLVFRSIPATPALNRWLSLAPNLAWWTFGILFHSFLPRVWLWKWPVVSSRARRANAEEDAAAASEDEGQDEDYHAKVQKRKRKGSKFFANVANRIVLVVINMVSVAIDAFVQVVSKHDTTYRPFENDAFEEPFVYTFVGERGQHKSCCRISLTCWRRTLARLLCWRLLLTRSPASNNQLFGVIGSCLCSR